MGDDVNSQASLSWSANASHAVHTATPNWRGVRRYVHYAMCLKQVWNDKHASFRYELEIYFNQISFSIASGEARPGFASLVKSLSKETLELANENSLASTTHAIKAGGQLACYAAIAMTTIGTRLVHFVHRSPLLFLPFQQDMCWFAYMYAFSVETHVAMSFYCLHY